MPARRLMVRAVALAVTLAPAAARAQFPITETFTGTSAPGWLLLGNAQLTGNGTIDPVGSGWLRLTSALDNEAGSAIYDTAFASSDGIVITFDYADYGGSGADGFSVYLIDGTTASPTVGSPGGPLGYAGKYTFHGSTCTTAGSLTETAPGVTNGYVGIGFDEYGNFSNCQSGYDGPGLTPQSVVVRGSGSGATPGFTYLAGAQVSASPFNATIDDVPRSSARHVRISVVNEMITAEVDFGSGYQTVIGQYNLATAPGQIAIPSTFKLGISASTGASTNYHEIQNLVVAMPVNLALSQSASPSSVAVGDTVTYTITVANDDTNAATGVAIADALPAGLTGVSWTLSSATGGATATAASGTGALSDTLDLPRDSSLTFTVIGTVDPDAAGTALSNTVTLTANGEETDLLANTASVAIPVSQMATATALSAAPNPSTYGEGVALTATVSSPVSGTPSGSVAFYDGTASLGTAALSLGVATLSVSSLGGGPHSLQAVYAGSTGYAGSASGPVGELVDTAPTGVALTSSQPASPYGQPVTFTAAVAPIGSGAGVPTGSVAFYDGSVSLGAPVALDATGSATLTSAGLGVGVHEINALYSGDANYAASASSALTQAVSSLAAAVGLAASGPAPVVGQALTLTAAVTSAAGAPTGTVTFLDGATPVGSSPLVAGTAALPFAPSTAGVHLLSASYSGDAVFAPGSAQLSLAVSQASTSVTLSAAPSSAGAGQAVTLVATVGVLPPGAGTPTGSVVFGDGSSTLGTSTLGSGGTATLVTALGAGTHALVAQYGGDSNFQGSASPTVSQVVGAGTPTALAVVSGSAQDAAVATGFATSLAVQVLDAYGNAVPGVPVTFTAPAAGASCALSAVTLPTDASGQATVEASANTTAGAYQVTASAAGVALPVAFALTNDPGAPASLAVDPAAATQTAQVGSPFVAPLGATVADGYGNPVPGVLVTFAAPASGATATLSASAASSDGGGHVEVDATAGTVAGSYAVLASLAGGLSAPFSLTNSSGAPATVRAIGGGGQDAAVATAFSSPLVVQVQDGYGNPVPGVPVNFQVPSQGASAVLSALAANTASDGTLAVLATANAVAGSYGVTATAPGASAPATLSLVNDPGLPAQVAASAASSAQAACVGAPFAIPLSVTVTDAFGNPVPGATVTFAAPSSGATAVLGSATATTGPGGTASVQASAGTVAGAFEVEATVPGVSAPALFSLASVDGAPDGIAVSEGSPQAALVGTGYGQPLVALVTDGFGNPVPGVSVTFSGPPGGATVTLSATSAVTGPDGRASVTAKAGTVAGPLRVTASAAGASAPAQFALLNRPGPAAALALGSNGSGQAARVGDAFPNPLSLQVVDALGNGVAGVAVQFACPSAGASCTLDQGSVQSDAAGNASVHATAGCLPGAFNVVASAAGLAPVQYHLTALVGLPGVIESVSGGSQSALVFSAYPSALAVRVKDAYGNLVPGAEVDYAVVSSGPQSAVLSASAVTTDGAGLASVGAVANAAKGTVLVAAAAPGAASPVVFSLSNVAVATELSVDIALPVYGTVIEDSGVTHLKVAVGPATAGVVPTGTVTFHSSRPVDLVPGQPNATQVGDAVVASLVDGSVDVQVQVVGWRSRSLAVDYAPDAAAASTFDPVSTTVNLTADQSQQQNPAGGCSTGGAGLWALLPLGWLAGRARRRRGAGGWSRSIRLGGLGALALSLLPPPAAAQVVAGLRVGYALPAGDAEKGTPLSQDLAGSVPIGLEVGYEILPPLTLEVYGSFGPAWAGSVCDGASCSSSVWRVGLEAAWRFQPVLGVRPWVGAGAGYEWAGETITQGADQLKVSLRGFELVNVQCGADYFVSEQLALGPFLEASLGRYDWLAVESPLGNSSGAIPEPALHLWLSVGLRGSYRF